MKFLLYSLNYSPELTGIGKVNDELCQFLLKNGVAVEAVVAPPYYPAWKIQKGYTNLKYTVEYNNGVTVYRCPIYVPKKLNNFKRIIHLLSFALSSSIALFKRVLHKPDVIFLVQPTIICAPLTIFLGKLFNIKIVMHVQDFEIDALLGLSNNKDSNSFSMKILRYFELFLISKFHAVSTISITMLERLIEKGVKREDTLLFPNWSDINQISPYVEFKNYKKKFNFSSEDRIILYSGNIGEKQGLEIILDAASIIKSTNVKFLIVGTGAKSQEIERLAKERGLTNVVFFPLQPIDELPKLLAMADIHLVIQRKGIADAVLPSKITNILAAGGHAIVTAEAETELGKLDKAYPGIYYRIEPEDVYSLTCAIEELLSRNLNIHNHIARSYAEKLLNKDVIISNFLVELKKMLPISD